VKNVAVSVNLAGVREAAPAEVADTTSQAARIALDKVTRLNGSPLGTAWKRQRPDSEALGTKVTAVDPVVRGAHTRQRRHPWTLVAERPTIRIRGSAAAGRTRSPDGKASTDPTCFPLYLRARVRPGDARGGRGEP
jgi:hypothetical protein